MGFDVEEVGPKLRFLTCWLSVFGKDLLIQPYQPNYDAVVNFSFRHKVARCPTFFSKKHTPIRMLQHFFYGHVFCMSKICALNPTMMWQHLAFLTWEALDNNWTVHSIARVLRSNSLAFCDAALHVCRSFSLYLCERTLESTVFAIRSFITARTRYLR